MRTARKHNISSAKEATKASRPRRVKSVIASKIPTADTDPFQFYPSDEGAAAAEKENTPRKRATSLKIDIREQPQAKDRKKENAGATRNHNAHPSQDGDRAAQKVRFAVEVSPPAAARRPRRPRQLRERPSILSRVYGSTGAIPNVLVPPWEAVAAAKRLETELYGQGTKAAQDSATAEELGPKIVDIYGEKGSVLDLAATGRAIESLQRTNADTKDAESQSDMPILDAAQAATDVTDTSAQVTPTKEKEDWTQVTPKTFLDARVITELETLSVGVGLSSAEEEETGEEEEEEEEEEDSDRSVELVHSQRRNPRHSQLQNSQRSQRSQRSQFSVEESPLDILIREKVQQYIETTESLRLSPISNADDVHVSNLSMAASNTSSGLSWAHNARSVPYHLRNDVPIHRGLAHAIDIPKREEKPQNLYEKMEGIFKDLKERKTSERAPATPKSAGNPASLTDYITKMLTPSPRPSDMKYEHSEIAGPDGRGFNMKTTQTYSGIVTPQHEGGPTSAANSAFLHIIPTPAFHPAVEAKLGQMMEQKRKRSDGRRKGWWSPPVAHEIADDSPTHSQTSVQGAETAFAGHNDDSLFENDFGAEDNFPPEEPVQDDFNDGAHQDILEEDWSYGYSGRDEVKNIQFPNTYAHKKTAQKPHRRQLGMHESSGTAAGGGADVADGDWLSAPADSNRTYTSLKYGGGRRLKSLFSERSGKTGRNWRKRQYQQQRTHQLQITAFQPVGVENYTGVPLGRVIRGQNRPIVQYA